MAKKIKSPTLSASVVKRSVSQTRKDIADWNNAKAAATRAERPRFALLQDIYDSIADDALLASQVNNRMQRTIAADFGLVDRGGKPDPKATALLMEAAPMHDIITAVLESVFYGYSVLELGTENGIRKAFALPRRNIDPANGVFYPDAFGNAAIAYRQTSEYGRWLLEFAAGGLGVFNKAVPHVLFKRFAQSCWSELCEIYGIPPRYIKTNTTDAAMLDRAENMLRDMGAAAAFVIDTNEEFQFAQGVSTNGDVYANLIRLCNNENSLLISGAIVGQDTENGNYSKEESAVRMLEQLVNADRRRVEAAMNTAVLPALAAIGWMPETRCAFRFSAADDTDRLWQITKELLPYKEVDNKWIADKFGVPVEDKDFGQALEARADFFV